MSIFWVRALRASAGWFGAFVLLQSPLLALAPEEALPVFSVGGAAGAALTALTGVALMVSARATRAQARLAACLGLAPGVAAATWDAVSVWSAARSGALSLSGAAWWPVSAMAALGLVAVALSLRASPEAGRPRRLEWLLGLPLLPLALSWHIAAVGGTEHLGDGDMAVVFGAGLRADGGPSDVLRDRVLTGVRLYREGRVSRLWMTGADHPGQPAEPDVMRDLAVDHGVPEAAITLDPHGDNTAASLRVLARDASSARLLMVSNDHHLARVQLGCRRAGLRCQMVPAAMQRTPRYEAWYRVREVLAFGYYALTFR